MQTQAQSAASAGPGASAAMPGGRLNADNIYDRINDIRSWSFGEVKKPETINYRTYRAEKDGCSASGSSVRSATGSARAASTRAPSTRASSATAAA
jgi:hypothetical protein